MSPGDTPQEGDTRIIQQQVLDALRSTAWEAGWDLFLQHYSNILMRISRHLTRYNQEESHELYVATLDRLHLNAKAGFQGYETSEGPLSAWLYGVVKHARAELIRKSLPSPRARPLRGNSPLGRKIWEILTHENCRLGETYQTLLQLPEWGGLTLHDFNEAVRKVYQLAAEQKRDHLLRRTNRPLKDPCVDIDTLPTGGPGELDGSGISSLGLEMLEELLARLRPEYRAAIRLTRLEGLSAAEAATRLGWNSVRKVHNAVTRGMRQLKEEIVRTNLELDDFMD